MKPKKIPVFDEPGAISAGYSILAAEVPVGHLLCDVYARKNQQGNGWEYQVTSFSKDGEPLLLNALESMYAVPGIVRLSDLMVAAGLLAQRPGFADEWAITINHSNDFPSNFPALELCNRAVDEYLVGGNLQSMDDVVVIFEIDEDGVQSNEQYINLRTWIKMYLSDQDMDPQCKFLLAIYLGNTAGMHIAVNAGANPQATTGSHARSSLHTAAQMGIAGPLRMLINSGADIHARDAQGDTPLHLASQNGHVDICNQLYEQGADLEAVDDSGRTPLMRANQEGHEEAAQLLRALSAKLAANQAVHEIGLSLAKR